MADVNTNVGVNIELNASNSSDYLNMIDKTVDGMEELKKAWSLGQEFTDEEMNALEVFNNL